jgi:hypothetical protein
LQKVNPSIGLCATELFDVIACAEPDPTLTAGTVTETVLIVELLPGVPPEV